MLTLTFRVGPADTLVTSRATCFRFCADGTVRGGDNVIAASHVDDSWRLGQRLYREWDCAGPVLLAGRKTAHGRTVAHGSYPLLKAIRGMLYAGETELGIPLPTWAGTAASQWHEIVLLPATPAP
jgi:hypothetical protein